ncbi:MAG: hypothetical protein BWY68_00555 [bacterium ADurb.Bin400]|nr:MAG: hypothetical protein BWY68_00555 [bacterium ADurb.Bin400]
MSTGLDVFDTTLQKTNEILKAIEEEYDWEGRRNQSYMALRAVLHAIRDRLPVDDSVNLAAQFPILLKGIYFDGWSSEDVPVRMDKEELLGRIRQEFTFEVEGGIEKLTRIVINKVFNSLDPGEKAKIERMLPPDIATLFKKGR